MSMNREETVPQVLNFGLTAVLMIAVSLLFNTQVVAQTPSTSSKKGAEAQSGNAKPSNPTEVATGTQAVTQDEYDQMARDMIRKFSERYKLGPQDSIAIRVKGQPDYSLEKAKVSPTGTI